MQIVVFFVLAASVLSAPFLVSIIRSLLTADPLLEMPWRDHSKQIQFILGDPLNFFEVLYNTIFVYYGVFYLRSFVGALGWLENYLPDLFIITYVLVLVVNSLINRHHSINLTLTNKIILFLIVVGSFLGILIAIYITWTPLGNHYIEGVQGRYFIPFSPIVFLILYNNKVYDKIVRLFSRSGDIESITDSESNSVISKSQVLIESYGTIFISLFIIISLIITSIVIFQYNYV